LLFQLEDLGGDRRRQSGRSLGGLSWVQRGLAAETILLQPQPQATFTDAQLPADQLLTEPFLSMQPDGLELFGDRVTAALAVGARPPRGAVPSLLCYVRFIHVNTSFIIEVSTPLPLKSVS
jgi:hypothetical protein